MTVIKKLFLLIGLVLLVVGALAVYAHKVKPGEAARFRASL